MKEKVVAAGTWRRSEERRERSEWRLKIVRSSKEPRQRESLSVVNGRVKQRERGKEMATVVWSAEGDRGATGDGRAESEEEEEHKMMRFRRTIRGRRRTIKGGRRII
ncbi:hypothetical protein ACFE04_005739 [Oxalis oulophora]